MKKMMMLTVAAVAAVAIAACGDSDSTDTTEASAGDGLTVTDAWARVTTPTQTDGAVYMTIESPEDDVLTGATVPSSVASEAQLHETTESGSMDDSMDDSTDSMDSESSDAMMGMKEVDQIDVSAGEPTMLEPGGYHIMLIDLAEPITDGTTIPVTLEFENAGTVEVDATAREE